MGNSFSTTVGYNSSSASATTGNLHRILNATIEQTRMKRLLEDTTAVNKIPMEVLIAFFAKYKDSHGKALGILRSTSGITSVISSSIFIWMIMRSHDRLSTTQHRLFLGLCISDIINSLAYSTFNAHAPSDNDYYVWNAKGSRATCDAQGFIGFLGAGGGLFYNASLNLYFLAVVKYNKNNEFIRDKIEPFLHGVPIVATLSYSIYRLVKKHYNDIGGGTCISPINSAPHCVGYNVGEIREGFEIPCFRGSEGRQAASISNVAMILIPALIMMGSLGMIYSAVRAQEKKLSKYGVGALRSNLQQQSTSSQQQSVSTQQQRTAQDKQSSGFWRRISISLTSLSGTLKSRAWSRKKNKKPITRSNNSKQSQTRAVMHKAFGYTFAWLLSFGIYMIAVILNLTTGSFPLALRYLNSIFVPLQGLFNLLIFMYPKIMAAKKSKKRGRETVSWCKAFSTAFWSKGKKRKNQGSNRSSLRGGSKRRSKKTKDEGAASDKVKSPTFDKIKNKKRRAETPQEEEKCEIQVPDNLNQNKTKEMHSTASTATFARNIVPSSTETASTSAVNPSTDDMVEMKRADIAENVNVGNALSDVVGYPDDDAMLNQDEVEEMEEIEKGGTVDGGNEATDCPGISADMKEQKQMTLENQVVRNDENAGMEKMNMDGNCEQASANETVVDGQQKEEEG